MITLYRLFLLMNITYNLPKGVYQRCYVLHYTDVIMGIFASQITSLTIVSSTVYSDADQRKYQSSASLAFVRGIHRRPVNSPHKWPVTRKMFPFDDVIMIMLIIQLNQWHWRNPDQWTQDTLTTKQSITKPCIYSMGFTVSTTILNKSRSRASTHQDDEILLVYGFSLWIWAGLQTVLDLKWRLLHAQDGVFLVNRSPVETSFTTGS